MTEHKIPDDLKSLWLSVKAMPHHPAHILIKRIAALTDERDQARAALAIADARAITLNADLGKMADALARMQGPVTDAEWDRFHSVRDAYQYKHFNRMGADALLAARAGAGE